MGVDGREVNVLGYMQFLMSTHKKKMFVQKLKKIVQPLGPIKMAYDLFSDLSNKQKNTVT